MQSSTWQRLEAIFFEALTLEPGERRAFIERECGGDNALREEVEAVLAAHEAMGEDGAPEVPADRRVGTRIGAYRLQDLIGRGGMGEVYRARRDDDLYEQEVAVKLVRSGLPPFEMARRFRLERQILARLEHPGIATLLDGGITPEGQPYLVMQYVRGEPITHFADAGTLTIDERLRLFVTVCRAVQFAHANLVVHRDLKPSNILVTEAGRVRLLDFGIAKLLDPEGADGTLATESLLLMTPEHAAPEQFLGMPVTTATDVYQLGVLLFDLLAGSRPFRAGTSLDLHRAICEHEAPRPSLSVGRAGDGPDTVSEADAARVRRTTPESLRRRLRGDLDRIVLMALRKEPDRRYGSAAELADDVERHLAGFPVRARPEGLGYVAGRFVRRHRFGVATGAALAASLVALLGTSLRFSATTSRQAETIAAERDVALEVSSFLEGMFEAPDPYSTTRRDTLRVRDLLDEGAERIRSELGEQPLVQARLLSTLGNAYRNLGRLDDARPLLEESLDIRMRESGEDTRETAVARAELATLLDALGRQDEAEVQLSQAIAVFERDSVTHASSLAGALGVLGGVRQNRGEYPEAEATYRRALALAETDSTLHDGRRAEHLTNLATALTQQAEWTEAEPLMRRALELSRAYFGSDHPTTATMLNNLGQVLREQERFDEAMQPLTEALAIRRERFEEPHPQLAISINNLADLTLALEDLEGAEVLFMESLEMRRAIYGERHPAVGVAQMNMGAVLQRFEARRDDAVRAYDEARSILSETIGPNHPYVSGIDGNLGRMYHDAGDDETAVEHFRVALAGRRVSLDASHPLVLGNLSDLGRCLTELGRFAEAEERLLESYAGLDPQRDELTRIWEATRARLARLYRATGREEEAARYDDEPPPGVP